SERFVRKLLEDAENTREADASRLRQIEESNRAERLIKQADERLTAGPDVSLNSAVADLGLALAAGDSDAVREKADALEQALSPSAMFDNELWKAFLTSPKASPRRAKTGIPRPPVKRDLAVARGARPLGKIFGGTSFTLDPQLCFVLMPFSDKARALYDDNIRPTVEKGGLRCERADDIVSTGLITHDIWERINRARLLIAELTDRNPNVFYELGLAHALSKDVILITQSMDSVPFDLQAVRCLCYDFTPRGVGKLESALAATIQGLINLG
ncbi:MAG TPA: hypothetical protein VLG15_06310, partial [Thermoanaerobaculia bacterium]|nr:hypothetical protein [Thermoanaerobaculia bacterium]